MSSFYSESVRINNTPKYAGVQWDFLIKLQKTSDQILGSKSEQYRKMDG